MCLKYIWQTMYYIAGIKPSFVRKSYAIKYTQLSSRKYRYISVNPHYFYKQRAVSRSTSAGIQTHCSHNNYSTFTVGKPFHVQIPLIF